MGPAVWGEGESGGLPRSTLGLYLSALPGFSDGKHQGRENKPANRCHLTRGHRRQIELRYGIRVSTNRQFANCVPKKKR